MNEVKPVSDLVATIIGFAVALGAAGTLFDATLSAEKDAARAISKDQLSYSKWNRTLQEPMKKKN